MVEHSAEEFAFNDEQDYLENVSHLEEYKQPAKMTSNQTNGKKKKKMVVVEK